MRLDQQMCNKTNDCSFNLPAFETDDVTSFPGTANLPITGCESRETKQPEMGRTVTIDSKYPDTSTTVHRTRQDNHNKIYCSQKTSTKQPKLGRTVRIDSKYPHNPTSVVQKQTPAS